MTVRRSHDLHERFMAFWANPPGWRAASAVNHTSVGLRYLVTGFGFFLVGGLLAMAIRAQLAWPDNTDLDHATYNQVVTMHGTTMMFLFAVPILEGLGVYLIPKMIGARDLPFPRLGAFGYWCYLLGGLFLFSSFFFDAAPDGGWFMYVPLNDKQYTPGMNADFWLLGVTFIEISALTAAAELIISILKTRAPGMTLARMPLFAWYMLVTAFMILFAFPPLILGSVLLEMERSFGFVFYNAARGGDPLLWQHLFWIFGHPEVYIIFLPAAGVVTVVVETFARRPLAGYSWVVAAVLATGFISFGLWVHHMFTTGIPRLSLSFFSAASMAVAIPSGIQVFAWIATLWHGRPVMSVPMLYVIGFFFTFVLGGLTGVMVALVPFDWQVHDSHFVVAHLHYVLFGGMVFPLLAGLYYWWPLFVTRITSERLGHIGFWLVFAGFNITFLPMHLTGMLGMPRRVYTYQEGLGWAWLNLISSLGGFLLTIGIGVVVADLYLHWRLGDRPARNPWRAGTLEWGMGPGVPPYNFVSIPRLSSRHPLWEQPQLPDAMADGAGLLADPSAGQRETLGTSAGAAVPEQVIRLPTQSWIPLWSALAAFVPFLGILLGWHGLSIVGVVVTVFMLLRWAKDSAYAGAPAHIDAGGGLRLPNQSLSPQAPGLWGGRFAMVVSAVTYAHLLFAYFFLWIVSPAWPPVFHTVGADGAPLLAVLLLVTSSVLMHLAVRANGRGQPARYRIDLAAAMTAGTVYLWVTALWVADAQPAAAAHAYASVVYTLYGVQVVHLMIALVMAGFVFSRSRRGAIDQHRALEARVAAEWWHYTMTLGVFAYGAVSLVPLLF